jgi:hypothetical protein
MRPAMEAAMSNDDGEDMHRRLFQVGKPDWIALDRETRWELVGLAVLLIVTVSMAAAVNLYAP